MATEIWKAVVGYPELSHVEVSNLGRIRTLDRRAPSLREHQPTQLKRGRVLSPWVARSGYFQISIKIAPKRRKYLVHRLVGFAFVTGYFEGASIDHVNGNKLDNRAENLQWVTLRENTKRQWATGLIDLRGEKHPFAKLSDADVRNVRLRITRGDRVAEIAAHYGVSSSLIYMIKTGRKRTAQSAI